MFKRSFARAFLASGAILLVGVTYAIILGVVTGSVVGIDAFALPGLGFYLAFPVFIAVFPLAFLVFLGYEVFLARVRRKSGKRSGILQIDAGGPR